MTESNFPNQKFAADNFADLPYASIGRRLAAFLIDTLILFIPAVIVGQVLPLIGSLIVWFFYAPILESSALEATLGKHLMGIKVADLAGRRLSFKAALIRNLLKMVSGVLLLIGFIMALFTQRKQALHDLIADSVVIYGRNDLPIGEAWIENVKAVFNAAGITGGATGRRSSNSIAELERLAALREKGALTEDEYQVAKAKVLSTL